MPGSPTFTASPWAYNGKVFFLSEDGETYVIEAGKEYRETPRSHRLRRVAIRAGLRQWEAGGVLGGEVVFDAFV